MPNADGRGAVRRVGSGRLRAGVVPRRDLDLALALGRVRQLGPVRWRPWRATRRPPATAACTWLTWLWSWSISGCASFTLPCVIVWVSVAWSLLRQLADLQGRPLDEAGQADAGEVLVGAAEDGDVAVLVDADEVLALVVPPEAVDAAADEQHEQRQGAPSRSASGACRAARNRRPRRSGDAWPGGCRAPAPVAVLRPVLVLVLSRKPAGRSKAAVSLTRLGPVSLRPSACPNPPGSNACVSKAPV